MQLPFATFISVHKGVVDVTPVAYEGMYTRRLGLLYQQRVEGPFSLEIEFINAVRQQAIQRNKRYTGM